MRRKLAHSVKKGGSWYNFSSIFWVGEDEKRAQYEISKNISFERIFEMSKFLDKLEE